MKFILTTLHVQDIIKSTEFYHEVLGLPIIHQFKNNKDIQIVMLGDATQAHIELIGSQQHKIENPGERISFGFEVEDIVTLLEKIKSSTNTSITGPISPNDKITMYFITDPDGFTVQLVTKQ